MSDLSVGENVRSVDEGLHVLRDRVILQYPLLRVEAGSVTSCCARPSMIV
jgi:hypothetical protein